MINTNGIKIANDDSITERLNEYMPGIEIYLQFDSFKSSVLTKLRGEDLQDKRKKTLE